MPLNYYAPIELSVTEPRLNVDRIDTVPPGRYFLENDRNGNVHRMTLRGPGSVSPTAQIATFNPYAIGRDNSVVFKILEALNR